MGIITASKILTSASPTLNAVTATSVTATTTTTTSLTSSGTGTGYFIQRVTYPGGVLDAAGFTSTTFANSICTANTMLFLRPVGWNERTVGAGGAATGSCVPMISIGGAAAGTFTLTSSSAASTALPLDVMLFNY